MTSLKQLQESFQKSLLSGDLDILSKIPDSPKEKKDVLLGVYQYAYGARLEEFLQNDYPQLHAYLGDEQFAALTRQYVAATPSHTPNARWYGEKLPEFITKSDLYAELPQIGDLATLEHALNKVFDEVDEPLLGIEKLAAIPPELWAQLVFQPTTATHRLTFSTNASDIWHALANEDTPPDATTRDDLAQILVSRQDAGSNFRELSYAEAMAWDKMAAGVPFGVLCELLAAYGGEDDAALRAAGFLQGWISSGLIIDDVDSPAGTGEDE